MKFPLFIIIASHLSDAQELAGGKITGHSLQRIDDHLNFAKWLLNKYHQQLLTTDIDPNEDWKEFIAKKTT